MTSWMFSSTDLSIYDADLVSIQFLEMTNMTSITRAAADVRMILETGYRLPSFLLVITLRLL